MHLNIQGRHLKITPALSDYVKEKIKKIKYYFDHVIHAHIVLEVLKSHQQAEVTITVEHHHFHNKVATEDMYKSVDLLFDKVEIQVRRYKEHQTDIHNKKNKEAMMEELSGARQVSKIELNDMPISDKPLSHLEAALQLEVDSQKKVIGYYAETSAKPSFLIQIKEKHFEQLFFDGRHWERKEVSVIDNQLQVHHIINEKLSTEVIEDAIDYLNHNQDVAYRFFISARANAPMLLIKKKDNHFDVIRENPL